MSENLKTEEIKQTVEKVLSDREKAEFESQVKASLEEAETAITALTSSVEEKDVELEKVKAEHSDLVNQKDTEIALYQVRVDQLTTELADVSEAKTSVDESLNALKSIAEMGKRVEVLKDKGIMLKETAFETQKVKVAALSDEDFDSYVDEMVSIKADFTTSEVVVEDPDVAPVETDDSIKASVNLDLSDEELEQFAKILGCDKSDEKCVEMIGDVAKKVKAYNESSALSDDPSDKPLPPKLDPKSQVMASLNLEAQPSETLKDLYWKLGEGMAKKAKSDK